MSRNGQFSSRRCKLLGINYTDDLSGKQIDRESAYQIQVTKFESDSKLIKSKVFYVSLDTMKATLGDQDMEWKTIVKGSDGKWN